MTGSSFNIHEASPFDSFEQWDQLSQLPITTVDFTPLSDQLSHCPTPCAPSPDEDPSASYRNQSQPDRLPLLRLADWDEEGTYDEHPPSCIHYSIEWKVTLNSRVVAKDTEQDLVLAPSSHWQQFLKPKLEKLLCRKFARNRRVESDDTTIVVSVNERSQRDLTRRFDNTGIDWPAVEKQLLIWGELFRAGPHCWRDPIGKKHYKLKTHHLKSLIKYVEQGGVLQTHEDVPDMIREQFIMNVLPGQSPHPSMLATPAATPAIPLSEDTHHTDHLNVPGLRDLAVEEYSSWQQSQVNDEILKAEFRKARDVALADGLDLEQVYEDQDPDFFVKHGVKRGIARRFVGDIRDWVKRYKYNVDGAENFS
ncbi:hypothetical protein BZG36_05503 [Bifiguratus adelaidae]|uniref:Uncharacterized protein n=1 Tax=Bifiguratus adelaidae TaxID=1938954 RepID=A0A261XT81_9FUNG|nr:hypothetical protein BZG36_05503 [Bifiguratus adelaidae]